MKKDLGLYIHIPFCIKKCDYCDFLSWKSTEKEREDYVRALEKEIKSYREFAREYRVSTVFFGGGTPSVLTGEQTERILDAVREVFQMEKEPEITLEMNPGTGEMEKLVQYRKMGINRLSIGLQSVKNENLKLLGRIHTYEEFLESCKWAREAGFDNISADLISSLPGHREELLPDEETSREIYLWTGKFLESRGFKQYEISNYARPSRQSRHNLRYWERKDYLGLGLGAASMVHNIRMSNTRDWKKYMENCENPKKFREDVEFLEIPRQMEEFMFLGLRKTRGVSRRDFRQSFGRDLELVFEKALNKHLENGMLKTSGDRIYLSEEGTLVSNQVLADFLFDC